MNATDQIAADLERLASARPTTTTQRQDLAQRVIRLREAEADIATRHAAAAKNQLYRAVQVQAEAAREFFKGDVPPEIEAALREIERLVG